MSASAWERWGAVAGIVSVVLVAIAVGLVPSQPGSEGTAQEFTAFFEKESNRDRISVSLPLVGLGGLFYLGFLGALYGRLRQSEGEPRVGSTLAVLGGVVNLALLYAGVASYAAIPRAMDVYDSFQLDVNTAMAMSRAANIMFREAGVAAAVLVGSASIVAVRTKAFPRWLAWAGLPIVILSVYAIIPSLPILLKLAWILAVSLFLLSRPRVTQSAAPPA